MRALLGPTHDAPPYRSEHALGIRGEVDRWHTSLTGDRRAAAGHVRDLVGKLWGHGDPPSASCGNIPLGPELAVGQDYRIAGNPDLGGERACRWQTCTWGKLFLQNRFPNGPIHLKVEWPLAV